MIPKETVGGLRIPIGRFLGIFPRHHKAALFFNFDEQPSEEDKKTQYTGDITVHAHSPYLGKLCDGVAKIDWTNYGIHFASSSNSVEFWGRYDPKKKKISGVVTLRAVDTLDCEKLPIRFEEIH